MTNSINNDDTNFDGVINPPADWVDVPRLSTNAVALGGPDGPMNAQANALVKQTKYLKNKNQELAGLHGSSMVGFTQEGVGAIARTAQDKMRDVVSVKDFGVVGDGVTDDTGSIQSALAHCEITRSSLFFPDGVYMCSGLTVGRVSIFANRNTVILWKPEAGSLFKITDKAVISGIVFDGNSENHTESVNAIEVDGGDGTSFFGCEFTNFRYRICMVENGESVVFLGNRFYDTARIDNGNPITFKDKKGLVANNVFENIGNAHCVLVGHTGLEEDAASGVVVQGNIFRDTEHVGVTFEIGAAHGLVVGNLFDNTEQGVKVDNVSGHDITVDANVFLNLNNTTGLSINLSAPRSIFTNNRMAGCSYGVVLGEDAKCSGNVFVDCGTEGHYFVNVLGSIDETDVLGNTFHNIQGYCINVNNGSQVKDNRISQVSQWGIRVNGEGAVVEGNRITDAAVGVRLQPGVSEATVRRNNFKDCINPVNDLSGNLTNEIRDNKGYDSPLRTVREDQGSVLIGPSDFLVVVDTSSTSISSADVSSILGGKPGQSIVVKSLVSSRVITLKNQIGNLRLSGDCVLDSSNKSITLVFSSTLWVETSRNA